MFGLIIIPVLLIRLQHPILRMNMGDYLDDAVAVIVTDLVGATILFMTLLVLQEEVYSLMGTVAILRDFRISYPILTMTYFGLSIWYLGGLLLIHIVEKKSYIIMTKESTLKYINRKILCLGAVLAISVLALGFYVLMKSNLSTADLNNLFITLAFGETNASDLFAKTSKVSEVIAIMKLLILLYVIISMEFLGMIVYRGFVGIMFYLKGKLVVGEYDI